MSVIDEGGGVEEKLRRILSKARQDGLSIAYAFNHFDKDGSGK